MNNQKTVAIVACAITNVLIMLMLVPISAILPTIADYFGVDTATASWVQTAYLLTLTSFLLISGRLGDLYGHRDVFLAGIVLFTVIGTLSGFVQDIGILILIRAIQGLAAALISGNSLAIIANSFASEERGMAIGVVAMAASFGALLGLIVSTSLAQYFNWQWLFYLTLPLGLVGIKAALSLKVNIQPSVLPKVDYLGAIVLAGTLTIFSLSLTHLHAGDAASTEGIEYHGGLLLVAAVGLLLFVMVERRVSQPMIHLAYLRNAPFTFSVVANEILHMTMMSSAFLMPFLLERGLGLTPAHTAGVIIASQIGNIATAAISGMIYDRTQWRFFCPAAMTFVSLGLGALALFAPTMPYLMLLGFNFALGLSLGFFNTPNNTIIMGAVPSTLRGFAAGMLETSRQMGHMLGITAFGAVLSTALVSAPAGASLSGIYVTGFQQAVLAACGIAFLGILASLVHSLSRPASPQKSPELVEVG